MGNQIPGNPQNGQIVNQVLKGFANNPSSAPFMLPGENIPGNPKALQKLKNNKFIRGQQGNGVIRSDSRPYDEPPNRTQSPIHGFYDIGSASKPPLYPTQPPNYQNNFTISNVIDSTTSPRNQQLYTPTNMRSRMVEPPKQKGFFQQLFNISDTQSQRKLRSSSASHASMSGNQRKINLLQTNVQNLERKLQSLNNNLHNSERGAQQLKFNLKNSQSRLEMSEANLKRTEQRAFYLQNQLNQTIAQLNQLQAQHNNAQGQLKNLQGILNQSNQQIQGLRQVLVQKDKRIYDGEIQIRTQMSQLQLLESRLQQLTVRDERKDKQIRQLSSAKFQLNATRIRLQNNLKINQQQIEIKNRKIAELDTIIVNKNQQLTNIRQDKTQLQQMTVQLKSELQSNLQKYEQQTQKLSSAIRNHLINIEENQAQILQLTSKVDKYYQSQMENQANIGMLEGYIQQGRIAIEKLQNDIKSLSQDNNSKAEHIQQMQTHISHHNLEVAKHQDAAQKIINDYNNAKKIGQKQIQFLQNKLQEFVREKQKLLQQIQVTKAVTVQKNKLFQRKIIYDLKQQNNRLWAKLIQNSEQGASVQSGEWKIKIQEYKNSKAILKNPRQIQSKINKNQLQQRFDSFIKKLQQNQNNQTRQYTHDISNKSLQKMQQNVQFYRQKCNQLQRMVQSHIAINKNLKDQIQKNAYYEANVKNYSAQMQKILQINKSLKDQNIKLKNNIDTIKPQSQLNKRNVQTKSKQIENQNTKFFQDISKLRNQIQTQKNQSRKYADEVRRLNNEMSVYKKWQGMYDDLKKKYDSLMLNSKEDYKGMYEQVLKQLDRLRNLYELKESDFDKLKKSDAQKFDVYQKQIKSKNNEIQLLGKDYDSLVRQFEVGKQQYQRLFQQFVAMQDQLNRIRLKQPQKLEETKP